MKYRTFFLLALTLFCGLGAGVFLTFNEQSLFGTFLSIFFPFAVVLLFLEIVYNNMHGWRSKEMTGDSVNQPVEKAEPYPLHHTKAA